MMRHLKHILKISWWQQGNPPTSGLTQHVWHPQAANPEMDQTCPQNGRQSSTEGDTLLTTEREVSEQKSANAALQGYRQEES